MATRKTVEGVIRALKIQKNPGGAPSGACSHVLTAEVIWPRPAIQTKVYASAATFNNGEMDCGNWLKSVVFKETVEGSFGVRFGVSEPATSSEIRKFFGNILKAGVSLVTGFAADAAGNEDLSEFITSPVSQAASMTASSQIRTIAQCEAALSLQEIIDAGDGGLLVRLPLVCPSDFVRRVSSAGQKVHRTKKMISKGEANGYAEVIFNAT